MAEPSGSDVFPLASRPGVSSEDEVSPAPSGTELGLPRRQSNDFLGRFLPGGSSVVVRRIKSDPRGTTGVLRAGAPPVHGCFRSRLGSNPGQLPSFRPLGSRGIAHVDQRSRTDSSSESYTGFQDTSSIPQGGSLLRQHNSSLISQESRRDPLIHAERNRSRDFTGMRSTVHHVDASICGRSPKCDGRCPEQRESSSRLRMDLMSSSVPRRPETLACEHRPIRYQSEPQIASVLLTSAGSSKVATDAMLQNWSGMEAYAFPPFSMIPQVLQKLRQSINCQITLIAPFWPQRPWFVEVLELLVEVPVSLPKRVDLLRQPHFNRLHQNLHVLELTAWRVSSSPPSMSASLRQWRDNLPSAEERARE